MTLARKGTDALDCAATAFWPRVTAVDQTHTVITGPHSASSEEKGAALPQTCPTPHPGPPAGRAGSAFL